MFGFIVFIYSLLLVQGLAIDNVIVEETEYIGIKPAFIATCSQLQQSKLTCTDCQTLSRCVKMNGEYQAYTVDICDKSKNMYCNFMEQRCSNSTGACQDSVSNSFECYNEGFFPNPYSCQKYYICLSSGILINPIEKECDTGFAYDVKTQSCVLKITDPVCSSLQFTCPSAGHISRWGDVDDMFYICELTDAGELVPRLHKCQKTERFDGLDCIERGSVSSGTTGQTIPNNTGDTTTSKSGEEFTCKTPGVFADPNICTKGYRCSSTLEKSVIECVTRGTYFDLKTESCRFGAC